MTREEFGSAEKSNIEKGVTIGTGIVGHILELWPSPSFARDWNHANQTIVFKMLSLFTQHEVLDCLDNYRYDNPDTNEPKFKEIAAKLWAVRKTRDGQKQADAGSSLPSWPTIFAWANRKSDDDLAHLWRVVTERYQTVLENRDNDKARDRLWNLVNGYEPRSGACLTIMWACEHDVELTFKRGTDEWHAIGAEYDRLERQRSVEEYKSGRRAVKLDAYPAEQATFPAR